MKWKNDREKIVRVVYDYFKSMNEHQDFISDSKTAKSILEVNSAKESNFILTKLLDELGDYSSHEVFTKKFREFDDGSFYIGRGNGFSEFNCDEYFKRENSEISYRTKLIEQENRIRDLDEKLKNHAYKFRHLDTANKFINFIIGTKSVLVLLGVFSFIGLFQTTRWVWRFIFDFLF